MELSNYFIRAQAELVLTVKTELTIGSSGGLDTVADDKREISSVKAVVKGECDKPVFPASSVKGVLRQLMSDSGAFDDEDLNHLLGHSKSSAKVETRRGVLLVGQATTTRADSIICRTHNSIDEVTGTAKENHLFTIEKVKPDTEFRLTLRAKLVRKNCWNALLSLLQNAEFNIGAGRTNDDGRVSVKVQRPRIMNSQAVASWFAPQQIRQKGASLLDSSLVTEDGFAPQPFEQFESAHDTATDSTTRFSFVIRSPQPLLIHDPVRLEKLKQNAGDNERTPDLVGYTDEHGEPMLPATSLRGVLRNRYRKIVRTLLHRHLSNLSDEQAEDAVDAFCAPVWGDTRQMASLTMTNGVNRGTARQHEQSFIAIDRFTGGVEKGAMLEVLAWETDCFDWSFALAAKTFDTRYHAQRAVLLMLLRDMQEGDIFIGAKKSAGFGQLFFMPEESSELASQWDAGRWLSALQVTLEDIDSSITKALTEISLVEGVA